MGPNDEWKKIYVLIETTEEDPSTHTSWTVEDHNEAASRWMLAHIEALIEPQSVEEIEQLRSHIAWGRIDDALILFNEIMAYESRRVMLYQQITPLVGVYAQEALDTWTRPALDVPLTVVVLEEHGVFQNVYSADPINVITVSKDDQSDDPLLVSWWTPEPIEDLDIDIFGKIRSERYPDENATSPYQAVTDAFGVDPGLTSNSSWLTAGIGEGTISERIARIDQELLERSQGQIDMATLRPNGQEMLRHALASTDITTPTYHQIAQRILTPNRPTLNGNAYSDLALSEIPSQDG